MTQRAQDLGIIIGQGTPGPLNAITDVPGVRVGHASIHADLADGRSVRTGVTVIEPRPGSARHAPCFAGVHVLNGNGDATGLEWVREAGLLTSPIAFTNTHSVGVVRDALIALEREALPASDNAVYWNMPVVMETFDGLLNDINGFHVKAEHVREAQQAAQGGLPQEGAVGGGSGMICHEFKGGSGTASRRLPADQGGWTVGAIVQANHGKRESLLVGGYPVGRHLGHLPRRSRRSCRIPAWAPSWWRWRPTRRCCRTSARGWRSAPASASPAPAAAPRIRAAISLSPSPPATTACRPPTTPIKAISPHRCAW